MFDDLERAWQERCLRSEYSPAVLGIGTIRVMGQAGDTTVSFPRLASLEDVSTLAEDERAAVETAQRLINEAQYQQRSVFALSPGTPPARINEFRPDAEALMIVVRVVGG